MGGDVFGAMAQYYRLRLVQVNIPPLRERGTARAAPGNGENSVGAFADNLDIFDMGKRMVMAALERSEGNVTRAAEMLGLTRDNLR